MTPQQNIQIGIDLGTTNSSIAINNNGNIEIIKKPGGTEYTPSIFGYNKSKNKVVGQKAYESYYKDADQEEVKNYKPEIKRLMGTAETFLFERSGEEMKPEEISAEILKSLKEDLLRKYPDFSTNSVVITIPAAFSVLQSEATKRAGNLAGFEHVVLLQEPIAAAISYGFFNNKNENWLIYDLGGGTFDVALVSSKNNNLSVLGHNGDNFLGGKNFDLDIVDKIIVPKILEKFSLKDFTRGNKKYLSIFSQFKYLAEKAKIELSEDDEVLISVDRVGEDDDENEINLNITFTRKEFEELIRPLVQKTIELAKTTIKDAGIKSSSISRVILVGGPTQIPFVREKIENDLKIKVDSSADPLTVVARGACIFGISQKIPKELVDQYKQKVKKGAQPLILNFESLTSDTEETISGIFNDLKEQTGDYYIQIQSDSGFYSSPKIKLKNGKFFDTVAIETNRQNLFWIYLFDSEGNTIVVDTDSFKITHGISVSGAPIPHSISVVVSNIDSVKNVVTNLCEKIFEKGSVLPNKKSLTDYKTSRKLKKGEDSKLDIMIVEGESDIPDRNAFLCEVGISGKDLPYDLPQGTPIEIIVDVNESREVFVTCYIPLIDLMLKARSTLQDQQINIKNIKADLSLQIERARAISENCSIEEKEKINRAINSIENSLKGAEIDEEEKRKANKELMDLKIEMDKLESEKELPQLKSEFNTYVENADKMIKEYGDDEEREKLDEQLEKMKSEGGEAVSKNDKILLIRINEQLSELASRALHSSPSTWIYHFNELTNGSKTFVNDHEAEYYIGKGRKAIASGDNDEIKRCVHSLTQLLPVKEQIKIKDSYSGITR